MERHPVERAGCRRTSFQMQRASSLFRNIPRHDQMQSSGGPCLRVIWTKRWHSRHHHRLLLYVMQRSGMARSASKREIKTQVIDSPNSFILWRLWYSGSQRTCATSFLLLSVFIILSAYSTKPIHSCCKDFKPSPSTTVIISRKGNLI